MGVERSRPLLTDTAREAGFTNEAGLDGTIRFLKNLTGLWVLQECAREWRVSSPTDWSDLEQQARAELRVRERPHRSQPSAPEGRAGRGRVRHAPLIDLEDGRFLPRGPMEERIHTYCREHRLPALKSRGEIVLAILWSIAESYRRTLAELERVTATEYDRIHLFGGGSRNALLCKLTAAACRREVVAGPVEATALGNLLIQARTMGDLPAGASIREISAASSDLKVYLPGRDVAGDSGALGRRDPPSGI